MYHRFDIQHFYVLPTWCIYVSCVEVRGRKTGIISLYSTDWLVFVNKTKCAYCAVRSTFYVLLTQCIYVFCMDLRIEIFSLYSFN